MQMPRGRHRSGSRDIFNFIDGDLECVYKDGVRRESIWKYRRQRECQGHVVLELVGGDHN